MFGRSGRVVAGNGAAGDLPLLTDPNHVICDSCHPHQSRVSAASGGNDLQVPVHCESTLVHRLDDEIGQNVAMHLVGSFRRSEEASSKSRKVVETDHRFRITGGMKLTAIGECLRPILLAPRVYAMTLVAVQLVRQRVEEAVA